MRKTQNNPFVYLCLGFFTALALSYLVSLLGVLVENELEFAPMDAFEVQYRQGYESMEIREQLSKNISVLCWVITCPKNHETKAVHVAKTWGKRCTKILFMTPRQKKKKPTISNTTDEPTEVEKLLDLVELDVEDGRQNLWYRTRVTLNYLHENYIDKFDWFMKADDDTYVIMENLRYMIYPYSPNDPIFIGLKFQQPDAKIPLFATGGPGYVMSKEALRIFATKAIYNETHCDNKTTEGSGEDVEISRCLLSAGVKMGDQRDYLGRQRMFHMDPEINLRLRNETVIGNWYWRFRLDPVLSGEGCCSELPVSIHYTDPEFMYDMEYLVYKARAFGVRMEKEWLPSKIAFSDIPVPPPAKPLREEKKEDERTKIVIKKKERHIHAALGKKRVQQEGKTSEKPHNVSIAETVIPYLKNMTTLEPQFPISNNGSFSQNMVKTSEKPHNVSIAETVSPYLQNMTTLEPQFPIVRNNGSFSPNRTINDSE